MSTRTTFDDVVLAYSGGLDTSAMVPWLRERYGCRVHCVVADVGQDPAELIGVEEKATRSGATSCRVVDLKSCFVEEFVLPTILTGAVYEGLYLLGTSMARPPIARALAEVAHEIGADALAHGCTGKGNDQVRFETAWARFAPRIAVIAPWREWTMRSREELIDYIDSRGIPCAASREKIYSRDDNLWHVSHEGGVLEDPWAHPPADLWTRTIDPRTAPAEGATVTISFARGRPVALDGMTLPATTIVTRLNGIAGAHGVGRIDIVENRLVGMKSRGCYETPGGTVLVAALRGLESIVLDRATLRLREELGRRMADLVYDGDWFTPAREAISAAAESIATRLDGDVAVHLHRGTAVVVGRRSPHSLYSEAFATFGADEVYDQKDAAGFIRLRSLPARIAACATEAAPVGAA